jgi:hypothetical protein
VVWEDGGREAPSYPIAIIELVHCTFTGNGEKSNRRILPSQIINVHVNSERMMRGGEELPPIVIGKWKRQWWWKENSDEF